VARIVGKSEANCRQLATRARRHLEESRRRFDASRQEQQELAERFFAAVADGDVNRLVETLAADVVVYGDGGGKAPQWMVPIAGADKVSRLFASVGRQMRELGIRLEPREINGQPGALVLDADGLITNVFVLDVADGAVQTVRSVINPDKLQHLGPVADVRALMRELRSRRE
jgi:RNA polymerase sigma-70 factor (ECF subfamily)